MSPLELYCGINILMAVISVVSVEGGWKWTFVSLLCSALSIQNKRELQEKNSCFLLSVQLIVAHMTVGLTFWNLVFFRWALRIKKVNTCKYNLFTLIIYVSPIYFQSCQFVLDNQRVCYSQRRLPILLSALLGCL